jgi:hypothetical protein
MKRLLACCSFSALAAFQPRPVEPQDVSLLHPTNPAHADAAEFARFLEKHGVEVRGIHRSHLESFFRSTTKAAFFRTNRGVVEVVFFPNARDAERIRITYSRTQSEVVPHRYVIEARSTRGAEAVEAAYPFYFTLHDRWYIVTAEASLDGVLKRALGQDRRSRP